MSGSNVGRVVVDVQTNKSGGSVAYGDVVINDTANAHAFTTTTTSAYTAGVVGVCIEPNGIASNATGRIQYQGYCAQVNAAASVTLGYFLTTHSVAKQATSSATRVVGSFGVAMKTSATPDAILWGLPDASSATGNMATDALWDAAGDLAVGTGANTGAKLTKGTSGYGLVAGASTVAWQAEGAWTTVVKAGDESVTSSAALQDDDHLFFTATSGVFYEWALTLIYASPLGAGTPDLKIAIGEDNTVRGVGLYFNYNAADSGATQGVLCALNQTYAVGTAAAQRIFSIWGSYIGGGGTFKLQWCQNSSGVNATTVYANSVLRYRATTV